MQKNLNELANEYGLKVYMVDFKKFIFGFSFSEYENIVLLNKNEIKNIGLGRYLVAICIGYYIDYKSKNRSDNFQMGITKEKYQQGIAEDCKTIAANILMPDNEFKIKNQKYSSNVTELCKVFTVPKEAVIRKNCNILERYKAYNKTLKK